MKKTLLSSLLVLVLAPVWAGAEVDPTNKGQGDLPPAFSELYSHYAKIRHALAEDSMELVPNHARALELAATQLGGSFSPQANGLASSEEGACLKVIGEIAKKAKTLAAANDIEASRNAFGELSKPMVRYREMIGHGPQVVYCAMKKGSWLQTEKEIGNPYYGASMARCGEVVSK